MKREFRSITAMHQLARLDDVELQRALTEKRQTQPGLYKAWMRRDFGYDARRAIGALSIVVCAFGFALGAALAALGL
jgi:hypothetical protein